MDDPILEPEEQDVLISMVEAERKAGQKGLIFVHASSIGWLISTGQTGARYERQVPPAFMKDLAAAGLVSAAPSGKGDATYEVTALGRHHVRAWASEVVGEPSELGDWIGDHQSEAEKLVEYLEEWLRTRAGNVSEESADSVRTCIQALRQELRTPPGGRHPGVIRDVLRRVAKEGVTFGKDAAIATGIFAIEHGLVLPVLPQGH